MSISEKYKELKDQCGRHERIFKHVGVANPQGGWYSAPKMDPDHGNAIPMLRTFFIAPKNAQSRLQEIVANGWQEFQPEPEPKVIKKATSSRKKGSSKAKAATEEVKTEK